MGFIKFIPFGNKTPYDVRTTSRPEVQLWQEFTILRYISGPNAIYGKLVTAPWIDQAKTYFRSACKLDWKSAGLLYYYSFLNLAKAYIVTKRSVSGITLKSTSIYHGLSAIAQSPSRIIDFEIEIHPPIQNGKRNIFAIFYERLFDQNWPFANTITVKLSEFIEYCDDISHELELFYGIIKKSIDAQSLLRERNNQAWFEMVVYDSQINTVTNYLTSGSYSIINFNNFSADDKTNWLIAYERTSSSLANHSLIRFNQLPLTPENRNDQYQQIRQDAINVLTGFICPDPVCNLDERYWLFIPKANTNTTDLHWHPLLSNYLFAFVLSTVLRYHPHIFDSNQKDSFIAEAWCNQSAITSLRYFLMEFTNPPLRMN